MSTDFPFTADDARRAVAAILSDPDFDTVAAPAALLALTESALRSPRALLQMLKGREGATLSAYPWTQLIERGLRMSARQAGWAELASYLKKRTSGLPRFNRALLEAMPGESPLNLSDSQVRAWERLDAYAQLFFADAFYDRLVKPRLIPLLAGPSGSGKSWLVRQFAQSNGWPFLRLSFADWLPRGSKGEPNTFTRVSEFLNRHQDCVIQVDELDKVGRFGGNEWTACVLLEVFGLLDRTLFEDYREKAGFEDADLRLKRCTFLLGTGTWQHFLTGAGARSIGFTQAKEQAQDRVRNAGVIPEEMLNRFNAEILFLEPPCEEELRRMASVDGMISEAEALGVTIDFKAGAESGLGVRWLESVATELALKSERLFFAP